MQASFPNHLRSISDLSTADVQLIIDSAISCRQKLREGVLREDLLGGKVVALIFEKPSLRTAMTFEIATHALGGIPVFLSSSQILASGSNQRGRESIPDIGRNVERFAQLIVARVYSHDTIDQLARSVGVPVVNALCDTHHPCQALADLMTIYDVMPAGTRDGDIELCFVGDGNNVATSLMQICAIVGINFTISCPESFEIPAEQWRYGAALAEKSGSRVRVVRNPKEAVKSADIIYSDTFVSMGQEEERNKRLDKFLAYQVNSDLIARAKPSTKFMHCLPAHRGEEVTDEVMDSARSIVFDQAENRLHIAKALLKMMMTSSR